MKRILDAQEVWMKNQSKRFWSERIKTTALLLVLTCCFFVVAWVEVPF